MIFSFFYFLERKKFLFYPTSGGKLYNSLRYEFSTEGLHTYRKLRLLENTINKNNGPAQALKAAKAWPDSTRKENYFYSSTTFMNNKTSSFTELDKKLDEQLKNIFLKK